MKPLVRFAQLSSHHQASLAALFEALDENGDGTHFFPHPLTATEADRLCNRVGLDEYIVLIEDGVVIGYGMLRGWDDGFDVPSLGFATHPGHRRKGVADAIVRELIQRAKARGALKLRLTVDANRHHVIDFISRHGFTFSPLEHDRLLGMLNLLPQEGRKRLRVGICAHGFTKWGGGVDLIVNHLRAMKAAEPNSSIYLLVPGAAPARFFGSKTSVRSAIKRAIKALIGQPRAMQSPHLDRATSVAEIIRQMAEIDPKLKVRYRAGFGRLAAAASDLRLDAVYLAMSPPEPRPSCALIGYVADYQHRHLPHLFSADNLEARDKRFGKLIASSDVMVTTSRAVTEDMRRFTPEPLPELHGLPFFPNLNSEWLQERPNVLSTYAIEGPYFIVCNQFWMHKDHLTVFRALAEIATRRPDVSLVCTGHTSDYRDPTFFGKLQAEAAKLGLGSRLRILGHIPKRDQIELLKHAVAVIQATHFEGTPGGQSAAEAVALGQRLLISEMPINREIEEGDVRFFPLGDHGALAHLMVEALDEAPSPRNAADLIARSETQLLRVGEAIWVAIRAAIAAREAVRNGGAPGGTRTHDL